MTPFAIDKFDGGHAFFAVGPRSSLLFHTGEEFLHVLALQSLQRSERLLRLLFLIEQMSLTTVTSLRDTHCC